MWFLIVSYYAYNCDFVAMQIDVLEKDMANHNTGYFESRLQAALPPLVTTKCRSIDCGNTIPQLIRSSLFVAPCTANLLKDSGVPFALHIQPMAEYYIDLFLRGGFSMTANV